jgi:phage terminase small subunit
MPLTDKQIRFCEEYLIDLNATQAAIRAGYSEKTAGQIGEQNLKKLEIQSHIQKRQKELQAKTGITQERVLKELAAIAFSDVRKFYDEDGRLKQITELDDDVAAAMSGMDIEELTVDGNLIGTVKKIKRWDKTKSLEMLAKHLGMFEKDNDQQNKTITVNIV